MEEMARMVATYGFPMVVALFLLVRLEKRLTELTNAINQMCDLFF
ncbi:YvrJ family protein [Sporomusa sphaeroides DSM 2875]|nr:YvrJ family protein [Sporomusa sphaeroides]MCM0760894.1 YvrJ family protein [Sporomusa sphaeroides DSM 2875]